MKLFASSLLAVVCLCTSLRAQAVPPPDKLLPADSLAVFTVPDMTTARRLYHESPQMGLWSDPALAPFVDKFWTKFESEVLQPIEKELGTSLTNLFEIARGQITLAVTPNGWPAQPGATPGVLLLLDSRDRADQLKELLDAGRARMAAGGETVKTARIEGAEFLVLKVTTPSRKKPAANDDGAAEPADDAAPAEEPPATHEFLIGQAGSLLVAGSSRLDIQKTLLLKGGGAVLALAESTSFMPDYATTLRDATVYGWINLEPVFDMVKQTVSGAEGALPMGLNPARILTALGFGGLKTVSMAGSLRGDGAATELKVRVPETGRRGLFRMMAFNARDSAPPPYVPADALGFSRTRIDLQRAWNTLEAMLMEISPQLGGIARMTVDAIGKDKDSAFDFRRKFVGNLGDDVITWQMAPQADVATAGGNPPQVALISSPKPDELAASMKLLMSMVPPDVASLEESEIAGSKVWSIAIPMGLPGAGQAAPPVQSIAFTAANGYLALATDTYLLKRYLESKPGDGGGLLSQAGLKVASEKVGGLNTGLFGFTNDRETTRSIWGALRNPEAAGGNPTAIMLQQFLAASAASGKGGGLAEWVDFSLLPPFEKVEKYFHYSVYSGAVNQDGFTFKAYSPKPPEL